MTASPLDPNLSGAFEAPDSHNGDISIVFRNKDMSIHGWDGSAWSTIYTRNGVDKQFMFPHTYEKYYVKSLTGSEETFSASFFSVNKYQGSSPALAGIHRGTKLHDIDEVPIYTKSDANKLLTIMSDGSLRWLGISESYVVEVIGTGGETPAEENPQVIAGTFLEELDAVAANLTSGADITDGIFTRTTTTTAGASGASYVNLKDDNIIAYDEATGETINREFTVSFWAKPEIIGSGYVLGLYGPTDSPMEPDRGCALRFFDNGYKIWFNLIGLDQWTGDFKTEVCNSNEWIGKDTWKHFSLVYKDNGAGSYITTLYVDGVPGATQTSSIRLFPKYTWKQKFGIGKTKVDDMNGFANSHFRGSLDSIQIGDGVALTDEQVAAIAAQADRQMSIQTAALLVEETPVEEAPSENLQVIQGTFLEELPAATSNLYNSAEIVDGIFSQTSGDNSLRGATKVDLAAEGIMSYSSNSLEPKEWTLSFWIKSEAEMGAGYHYCGGRFKSNDEFRLAMGNVGGFMQFKPIFGALWTGTPKATSTIPFAIGQWHHCAMTYSLSDGFTDKYDLKVFIDGVKGGEALQQNKHVIDKVNGKAWFGLGKAAYGESFNGNWGQFSMDSVQIKQGALTEEQVAHIAAQTDRQMSIETASS